MKTQKIAVVGLGYWGPNHVRNLHELPGAEVAAICDLRPEALAAIARRYPAVPLTTELDHVLADADVDGIVIATPIGTHYPIAKRALEAGKHVLVEKPLAASSEEALGLIELANERGLVLMAGHTFLYSPAVNKIREVIAGGELGEIHFISSSRVNLGLHQADASVLWDLAPHDFSILHYLLGTAPTHVSALCRDCVGSGTPDVAFINLEYASGAIAHVELSWLAPSKLRRTTIVGSEKMLVYDDTANEPVRIFDSGVTLRPPRTFGEFQLSYRTGDIISPRIEAREPLLLELADFCAAITTGVKPCSSAEVGLEVVRLIEAAERSTEIGGGRVAVGDVERAPAYAPVGD